MAKSGSKEWHKEKYEAAKKEAGEAADALDDALAKVKDLESQLADSGLRVDTSLLSERRLSGVNTFFHKAQRYCDKDAGQIAAACLADLAEGARRVPVQGLMGRLKRINGLGLR